VRGMGDAPTGVFFTEQTVESLMDGILRFEVNEAEFIPATIQAWSAEFATSVFLRRMREYVLSVLPAAADAMRPALQETR
jgi:hypothetical protein